MKNIKNTLTLVFFATIISLFMSSCSKGGEATPDSKSNVVGRFIYTVEGFSIDIDKFNSDDIANFKYDEGVTTIGTVKYYLNQKGQIILEFTKAPTNGISHPSYKWLITEDSHSGFKATKISDDEKYLFDTIKWVRQS